MRYHVTILAAVLSFCALHAGHPNIVLVMADDQGWGDMGYQGHPVIKTPHFDEMAAEALRFENFHAAAPVCSPTRASVLTGRHPNRMGVFKHGHPMRPQEITIAEALKTAGYATGLFGKWHIGSVRKGSPVDPGASGFDVWLAAENYYDNNPILSRMGEAVQMKGESSMVTAEAAIEFMRAQVEKKSGPFLAVVWFGSPHLPHKAAAEDKRHYAGQPEKMQDFYGEITGMDRAFGKIRKAIRELGIRDNTILWYLSDNGGLFKETSGGRGKKGEIYQGGLRVPGLLEWPSVVTGPRITKVPAVTSDIYPTLLEITGVMMENQPPLDGGSLLPVLKGADWTRPRPIGFWDYPAAGNRAPHAVWMKELLAAQAKGEEPGNPERLHLDAGRIKGGHATDRFPGHAAWLDGDWKLHRIQGKRGAPEFELYQLSTDPMEAKDLSAIHPERVASMKSQLEKWLGSVVGSLNGSDYQSE